MSTLRALKNPLCHLVYTLKVINLTHGSSAGYTFVRGKKKSLAKMKCALLVYEQALKSNKFAGLLLVLHTSATREERLADLHLRQGRGSLSSSSSSSS